jgi:hypothetical protein
MDISHRNDAWLLFKYFEDLESNYQINILESFNTFNLPDMPKIYFCAAKITILIYIHKKKSHYFSI